MTKTKTTLEATYMFVFRKATSTEGDINEQVTPKEAVGAYAL